MIFDHLDRASRYASLHPLLAEAFAWLATHASQASAGRHPIRGEDLIASVNEEPTRSAAACRFEAHRRYIDVQVALAGQERIEWAPQSALEPDPTLAPGPDVWFFRTPPAASSLLLHPGTFAIFWPEDAHRPGIQIGEQAAPMRKVVFKLAVNPSR